MHQFILIVGTDPAEIIGQHELVALFTEYAAEEIGLWHQVRGDLEKVTWDTEFISADDQFYYYETKLEWSGADPVRPVIVQWDHRKF